jgi:hypothetical protein
MGLFSHHEDEPETGEFMGLVLGTEALQTPSGTMRLADITCAEFLRTIVEDGPGPEQTSTPAVVGGAAVGGALFGAQGAVVGGYAGSTVKEEGEEKLKTLAVQLIFKTDGLSFEMDIPREREDDAVAFAETVKSAVKRHKDAGV